MGGPGRLESGDWLFAIRRIRIIGVKKIAISLFTRLAFAIVAGILFLAALFFQGWMSDRADKLQAQERLQERLAANLRGQIEILHEEREDLEAEHQRQLNVAHDWLGKVAVPRETILRTARLDAIQGSGIDLDHCQAEATLESDGWNVTCGLDLCLIDPKILHYVVDPLTGKILSKRVVGESERKP
jgi:hypothetical protein